jgi:Uma2 family endonuclease
METVFQTLVSADDLFRMPADGVRRELVRGELFEMSPVGTEHGLVLLRLGYLLTQFLAEKNSAASPEGMQASS